MRIKQIKYLSAVSDAGGGAVSDTASLQTETLQAKTGDAEINDKSVQSANTEAHAEASTIPATEAGDTQTVSMNEIKDHVNKTVAEELKKSSMSEPERKEYELEQKQKLLDEREKVLTLREMKVNAEKLLTETGLSASVADVVLGEDMTKTAQNIKKFKDCLDKEVHKQVSERLKGKTPEGDNSGNSGGDSIKAQFLCGLNGV